MQSIVQSAGKSGHRDNCNHYNCNDEHNDEEKYDDKYDCCKDDHQLPTYSPYEEHPKDQFGIFWTTQSSIDAGMHTNTNALQNSLDTLRISDTNLLDFCDTFPTTN